MSKDVLSIKPFGNDRTTLIDEVDRLLVRMSEATEKYLNSTCVVHLSEERVGENDALFTTAPGLTVKDIFVLAMICQAPLGLLGSTDRGKTALASLALQGIFGEHKKHWWRVEISSSMSADDLLEIDMSKLADSKLSEAMSAAPWLSFPGRLADEINRCPAKLANHILHLIDGSGLHLRGDLFIPVGLPYRVNGKMKRYSFTTTTENPDDYEGTYTVDPALVRRIVLSVDLDDNLPSVQDLAKLMEEGRAKLDLPQCSPLTDSVIRVYESLPTCVPISPLAKLFLHYLSGLNTCVRTRSGRLRIDLQPGICDKCHLYKSHPFCGRVGGLSEGLLLWTKEVATGIAAVRAAKVLRQVREDCEQKDHGEVQRFLDSSATGSKLFDAFRRRYLAELSVIGEDVIAAYSLIAPNHVYIDRSWLEAQAAYENRETYAFADVAARSWEAMQQLLRKHGTLFDALATDGELSPVNEGEVESLLTTENAAMLAVISALRSKPLSIKFNELATSHRVA